MMVVKSSEMYEMPVEQHDFHLPWMKKTATSLCSRPEHGEYTSYKVGRQDDNWSGCPMCAEEIEQLKVAEEREQFKAAIAQQRIGDAAIPVRFASKTLDTFVADTEQRKRALTTAQQFVDRFNDACGMSLILLGKPGTGKTHIACGIGHALMAKHRSVMFTTTYKAILRVKETWGKGSGETETQVVRRFVDPDLLIIDEVGVQFGSETEKQILFNLINERYENVKSTIAISNLNIDDVKLYLGERIMDRFREGGGKAVMFNWGTYRK